MDSYLINKVPKETLVQLEEFSAYLKDHRKTRTSYASVIKTINILKVSFDYTILSLLLTSAVFN